MSTKLLWIGANSIVGDTDFHWPLPGVDIETVGTLSSGIRQLASCDLVLLDVEALDSTVELAMDQILRAGAGIPAILYHRTGSVDDAIHYTRLGGFHTFIGRLERDRLLHQVARVADLADERAARNAEETWRRFLIGESDSMLQICEIIRLIAAKRCTILISGETGTGKEVIARAIHAASNRASQPMVAVNCTALPTSLIETELFGHAKGAFTGAHASRIGRFEQAHRGSIFLDEIGDLPLDAQVKLLRVLQEQEFQRVGSSEAVKVDVRVIAATNVDLEQAIRERKFREDLYYRLNVVPIHLPPLRERREDIPHLLNFFLEKIRAAEFAQPKHISEEAIAYLQQQEWPGNVRQLEHAVQMAFALSGDRTLLTPRDFQVRSRLSSHSGQAVPTIAKTIELSHEGIDLDDVVSRLELSLLNQALKISNGNKARAAELLGIKRTTLLAKLKSRESVQEACA